jgi:hypothetical protein
VREFLYFAFGRVFVAPARRGGRMLRVNTVKARGRVGSFLASLYRELGDMLPISGIVFLVFGIIAGLSLLKPIPHFVQILLGTITCGLAIPIYYAARYDKELNTFRRREQLLDGDCKPDGAPYNAFVVMRRAGFSDRENFLNEFRSVPAEAKNIVLVLRQTRTKIWYGKPPNTVESMKRQLEHRNKDTRASKIEIKWVCIENQHSTFEAYLSYARFEADILYCQNPAYAELLNQSDIADFRSKLADHLKNEQELKKECVVKPAAIVGLKQHYLPSTLKRREVLSRLVEKEESEVMLVSDDRKRLGMVTLGGLVKRTFASFLPGDGEKQLLERKIQDWTEQCRQRVADLEAAGIQPPPAATGDEQPDYDTMVPADMGRWRGTGDLRFRQP